MKSDYDFLVLEELQERSQHLYDQVKEILSKIKNSGSSIIGHPLLRLENKLISFHYSVLSHLLNTEVENDKLLESVDLSVITSQYNITLVGYEQEFLLLERKHRYDFLLCA